MRKIFLSICCVTLLWSCAKERLIREESYKEIEKSIQASNGYIVSVDSVAKIAQSLPRKFSNNPQTKSSGKVIKEIIPFTAFQKPLTKSIPLHENPMDNIYVVNYANNEGYAIISADTRVDEVIGYSDKGNITDTMSNPGMRIVMDLIPDYVTASINEWDEEDDYHDDTIPPVFPPVVDTVRRYSAWQWENVGPFITTTWDQGAPFNNLAPESGLGGRLSIGCVTTAMLQICAYHRFPQDISYNGTIYSPAWYLYATLPTGDSIRGYANGAYENTIANVSYYIAQQFNTQFSVEDGGVVYESDFLSGLNDLQYIHDGRVGYTFERVKEDLNNARPVLIRAEQENEEIGHRWIIDGYRRNYKIAEVYEEVYDYISEKLISETYLYTDIMYGNVYHLRLNWGWGGYNDGWYVSGIFGSNNRKNDNEFNDNATADDRTFNYDMSIIKNLRPYYQN